MHLGVFGGNGVYFYELVEKKIHVEFCLLASWCPGQPEVLWGSSWCLCNLTGSRELAVVVAWLASPRLTSPLPFFITTLQILPVGEGRDLLGLWGLSPGGSAHPFLIRALAEPVLQPSCFPPHRVLRADTTGCSNVLCVMWASPALATQGRKGREKEGMDGTV